LEASRRPAEFSVGRDGPGRGRGERGSGLLLNEKSSARAGGGASDPPRAGVVRGTTCTGGCADGECGQRRRGGAAGGGSPLRRLRARGNRACETPRGLRIAAWVHVVAGWWWGTACLGFLGVSGEC
jgi:hypothetical protein